MTAPIPWPRPSDSATVPLRRPQPPLDEWRSVMGEYFGDGHWLSVFERDARLWVAQDRDDARAVSGVGSEHLSVVNDAGVAALALTVARRSDGRTVAITADGRTYLWKDLPADPRSQLRVTPVRPIPEVLSDALGAAPPVESGEFSPSHLVDLTDLEPTIRLDVRYASSNNFLGHPFYSTPRALLQRPVAESVAAAQRELRSEGFGLVVLDAYRPWYVTKAFWDATPVEDRWIVADPARGSRHNRGAAADVTLVDLSSGALAEMPSTFDEPTPRAFAFYPGGSSLQRWHRALLLRAMEAEGFTVNDYEWWHFDHREWSRFKIENLPVE